MRTLFVDTNCGEGFRFSSPAVRVWVRMWKMDVENGGRIYASVYVEMSLITCGNLDA